MNKRGIIIRKEDSIPFDETLDHIPNIENIIRKNYPDLIEYINLTTNIGLCIAITNQDDIIIRNCSYDSNNHAFAIYLPSELEILTPYQNETLKELLKQMDGIFEAVSYHKLEEFEKEDIPYTKEELEEVLENHLRNQRKK